MKKSASASEQLTKETRSKTLKQVTLEESSSRTKLLNSCDPRTADITTKVGEMIALDCQPFSIVDSVGFVCVSCTAEPRYVFPSRRYITEMTIPQIMSCVLQSQRIYSGSQVDKLYGGQRSVMIASSASLHTGCHQVPLRGSLPCSVPVLCQVPTLEMPFG